MVLSKAELASRFTFWDYLIVSFMLLISGTIGVYHAFTGGNQRSQVIMADRNMRVFPVCLSLTASYLSAITLLGVPAEVYVYNTSYWFISIAYFFMVIICNYLYLPLFYNLELVSIFEYLEFRFSKTLRRCGSFLFIIQMIIYLAVALYAPALTLNQVTGLKIWTSVVIIGVVCTLYTTLSSGIKAVIWADTFQMTISCLFLLIVIIKGLFNLGGFQNVWQIAREGSRVTEIDFSPDPTIRHTFWSLVIGGTVTWIPVYGINQSQIQRYLTTKNLRSAQDALWWNLVGMVCVLAMCCLIGLIIYATYWNCDPLLAHQITTPDQIFPYYVMDQLGLYHGMPGLFVSVIFSGTLSTFSAGINSLAAVTFQEIVISWFEFRMTRSNSSKVMKFIALFYGVLCILLVSVAQLFGDVLQTALTIFGVMGGPLLGVFTLGMFFRHTNKFGAGVGLASGLLLTFSIAIGALVLRREFHVPKSPTGINGCIWSNKTMLAYVHTTTTIDSLQNVSALSHFTSSTTYSPSIFKLSYLWFSLLAFFTVVIIGLIASFVSGGQDQSQLDPVLTVPFFDMCCFCLPVCIRRALHCGIAPPLEIDLSTESLDDSPDAWLSSRRSSKQYIS